MHIQYLLHNISIGSEIDGDHSPQRQKDIRHALPETNTSHQKMDGWKTSFLSNGFLAAAILVSGRVLPKVSKLPPSHWNALGNPPS